MTKTELKTFRRIDTGGHIRPSKNSRTEERKTGPWVVSRTTYTYYLVRTAYVLSHPLTYLFVTNLSCLCFCLDV